RQKRRGGSRPPSSATVRERPPARGRPSRARGIRSRFSPGSWRRPSFVTAALHGDRPHPVLAEMFAHEARYLAETGPLVERPVHLLAGKEEQLNGPPPRYRDHGVHQHLSESLPLVLRRHDYSADLSLAHLPQDQGAVVFAERLAAEMLTQIEG